MNNRISLQIKGLCLVKSLFVVLLAAPGVASAITIKDTNYPIPTGAYFVSPDGKDTNSGKSVTSPWSFTKALSSAPAGSTIVFRGGQYYKATGPINRKLTLQAYPHEQPWLKGSIQVKDWVADGAMWRKDGWNYSLPLVESKFIDPKYPMARYTDMVYINGVSLTQVGSKANVGPGKFYVDKANNKLYIGNNPTTATVEATVVKLGLTIYHPNSLNTVVRGLGFAHYAEKAIFVGASHVQLENNTIAWNGVSGVGVNGGTDAVVRGNTFSYNALVGLNGHADRILLEGNTISYNNVEHFRKTWGAAGVKLIRTSGSMLRDNIVENNYGTGIWLDVSCLGATIANNTSRNNEGIGIFYELSHKASISGNTVHNNGTGIILSDSSGSQVVNNILANNRNEPIRVKDTRRVNTNRAEIALGITWISRDNVVENNSF